MKRLVLWSGLAVMALLAVVAQAAVIDAGKIYVENCAICHGDAGNGKTATQNGLTPRPRDFTSKISAQELTRERMIFAVTNGRRGTAMMAHKGRLTAAEIEAVVDHIRAEFMQVPAERKVGEPPLLSLGEVVYTENCSVCHGDKGSTAYWARNGLNPPPRDFTGVEAKAILTRHRMITSVTHGRPGTGMQPFKSRLSAQDIEAVVNYIRHTFMGISADHDSGRVASMQTQEVQAQEVIPAVVPAAVSATLLEAPVSPPVSGGIPGIDAPLASKASPHAGAMPGMPGLGEQQMMPGHGDAIDMSLSLPKGLVGDPVQGRDFFMKNCFVCHGVKGDGNGPRAYFNIPRPRNFTSTESRLELNRPRIFGSIKKGRPGTVMPAWGKVLNDQQIANIAEFVFLAFIEDVKAGGVDPASAADVKKKLR